MGANSYVINPKDGTISFGSLPALTLPGGYIVPAGIIVLKEGAIWKEQKGLGGFGVKHIWEGHHFELVRNGYTSISDVPRFVSDIITPGADLYYEGNRGSRMNVLQSKLGIVILEYKISHARAIHSVVSAYTKRSSRGVKVHTL